jgi:putative ATP-dependent endonuclease of OLD family
MELVHLTIKNFRNFENVEVNLTNKNVVFGINDIGKSNFLAALRFLLDRNLRKDGFIDSDFYNKLTDREIEITLSIDITDEDDNDNKKIFKMMKGAIPSDAEIVYFQLKAKYDNKKSIGDPMLFWGIDPDDLEEIPNRQSFYELDKHLNVVYIDSSIQLDNTFKRYSKEIFKKDSSLSPREQAKLESKINTLNTCVGGLSAIKSFETDLIKEYKKFRYEKDFNVRIKSEIEINNLYSKLTPYILDKVDETYPTAGDGRKKILAYTLLTLENRRKEEEQINIFLIEELENHLHRSMQLALSFEIFSDKLFKYLFLTTHSSLIVSQMDDINLVKLVREGVMGKVVGKSYTYSVPKEYITLKQKLNQNLADAIYADTVLLVEGPSEKILFERVLHDKCPKYESLGGYILEVEGINFKEYYKVLDAIGIKVIVRTDNDLKLAKGAKTASLIGLNRCLDLINEQKKDNIKISDLKKYRLNEAYRVNTKQSIYDNKYPKTVRKLISNDIFLSRVDLENDLYEVIPDKMDELSKENGSEKSGVEFLQHAKLINMIKLCKLFKKADINKIFIHDRFECLRKLVESCCQ